ncbi:hypothetical protein [Sinorhizobium meliloti]|uniref:hypothetical protein n=1 Tax=Rhizobium meliloti TaxID=382 RepID=UPI001F2C9295|nr:hypothetical protein [Sinorhizobium meliloti]
MRLELHALLRAADAHPRLRNESLFSGTVVHYVERGLGIAVIDPLAALVVAHRRPSFAPRIRYELSVVYAPSVGRSPMFDGLVACLVKHYSRIVREVMDRLA